MYMYSVYGRQSFTLCLHIVVTKPGKKSTRPASSAPGGGVSGRRGKRKRPPVEDGDEADDTLVEGSEGGDGVMVEGREGDINGLLKQLVKVLVTV